MNHVEHIFVYGSLTEGMVHYDRVKSFVKNVQPAWATGSCFRLPVGYPVLVENDPNQTERASTRVYGQLLEIEASDLVFKILDEYHGFNPVQLDKSLSFKKAISVELEDGSFKAAHTYFVNPAKLPPQSVYLADGDWRKSLETQPAMTHQLSDAQVTYVRRLGSSTGREIVPIDLGLYRELMKLELIVDKGRRLALTKLGKDVFKYLG
jgi:gamma-glutamylcyclotransferase (GGCT)/AIG2-like uncharacterized protein YtfP